MKQLLASRVFLCVVSLFAASSAVAQYGSTYASVKGMDERFRLDLGAAFQTLDTTVRLDSPVLGIGTDVSLENDLGQKSHQTSLRGEGYLRLGRHARLDFGALTGSRTSTLTLARDIQFGDHVYHVGATADSNLRFTQADLYLSYSFVNTGEAEVGLQLGVSALFVSSALSATGFVTGPGGTISNGVTTDDRNIAAPVPAVGGYLRFTLLPGFFISARAKGLPTITVSDYNGSLVDVKGALDYYLTPNVGIGGGYAYTKLTFNRTTADSLKVRYVASGPLAYLTLAF